ncbi:MAG: cryptochrome/photolyase family protein [Litorivicinaceae bacterium]
MTRCCLVLGDQLSDPLSSLNFLEPEDVVLMVEVWSEASYVKHHKQKIALVFSAMRHFADELRANGRSVIYVPLTDPENTQSLTSEVERHQRSHHFSEWLLTEPGEWRLKAAFDELKVTLPVPLQIVHDDRFICSHDDFQAFLTGRKQPRMEHFYRKIRQSTGILMDGGDPVGGQWNFDHDNRKALDQRATPNPPQWPLDSITEAVIELVNTRLTDHFGVLDGADFRWPVNREQALFMLDHFITARLPSFGDFQDAMVLGKDTLFHSLISTSLNLGLLRPMEVCQAAEEAYRQGHAPINAVEGFIRQIIGWREYVRGLYWAYMPDYQTRNSLNASWPLPAFFWDESKTGMVCLSEAIRNTRENAYAHHIQRLMVTGNFALIAGCSVTEVCEWYLSVYADAYEWVELPNTLGMALFADDGVMASKPYCASGKYIDRMSDYCKSCRYQVKETETENACPFNYLYWDFLMTHQERFRSNPRMAMILRNLDRFSEPKLAAIRSRAMEFRARIESTGSDVIASSQESLL